MMEKNPRSPSHTKKSFGALYRDELRNEDSCAAKTLAVYALHAAQHHNQVRSARQVIATDRLQWLRVQELVIARVVATGSAVRAASAAQSTTTVELALARRSGGLLRSGHLHGT